MCADLFGFSAAHHHLQLCNLHSSVQLEGFSGSLQHPNAAHPSRLLFQPGAPMQITPLQPLSIQMFGDSDPQKVSGAQQEGHKVFSLLTLPAADPAQPSHPGSRAGTPNSSHGTRVKDHFLTSPNQYLLDGDLKTPDSFPRPKPLDK